MSIGKSLRFEVFARDQFTCQYCGSRPPDVILEADHIHPVSKGGLDEILNLITSCFACNRGKKAKILSDIAPSPDADLIYLKTQQEIAEVKRYLRAKKVRDKAFKEACDGLLDCWQENIRTVAPEPHEMMGWIKRYGPEEVEQAIYIAARRVMAGGMGWGGVKAYMGGILRKREQDADQS